MAERNARISGIVEHFHEKMHHCRKIVVPDWIDKKTGEPYKFYVWPATLAQLNQINRRGGPDGKDLGILVETIIVRARREDKTPYFQQGDRAALMNEADPEVLSAVVRQINDDEAGEELEVGGN